MSKIFYDDLIDLSKVERKIRKIAKTEEERSELWKVVDEIVHHRVMGCILGKLPGKDHGEFLEKFHERPHDEGLFDYLKDKAKEDIKFFIKEEAIKLGFELLDELHSGLIKSSAGSKRK